ncbi:hypothetical protein HKX48_009176 [Thoreauomyces humboldtii]|nr:hypothetical protein HKX48_009176 [Thoreauomyces humboldtii]
MLHSPAQQQQWSEVVVVLDEEQGNVTGMSLSQDWEAPGAGTVTPASVNATSASRALPRPVDMLDSVRSAEAALQVAMSAHHSEHLPLLDPRVARFVSSVSTACRISLRTASILVEAIFESLKFSASASLGITRRALVTAISSARTLHLIAMGRGKGDSVSFFKVLDRYTSVGVYVVHNVFSLAELLTHTTFHLASSTIRFSLNAAEECVQVLDGLFGETETSKALSAFICLVKKELQGHEDDLSLSNKTGRISALGQITKALTYVNRNRWRNSLKMTAIFEGHVQLAIEDNPAVAAGNQIEAPPENSEDAVHAELQALTDSSREGQYPPISMSRARYLGAMDRRRMSNPEKLSSLAFTCDAKIDFGIGSLTREDSGLEMLLDAETPFKHEPQSRHHGHDSLTPDGRRQRTHSGNSSYKLDHAQVASVLRMLESVQIGGTRAPKTKRQARTEKTASAARSSRGTTSHSRHLSRSNSGRFERPPPLLEPPQPNVPVKHSRHLLFEKIARYVRFASGAYGTNFLKILGIGKARDFLIDDSTEHHNNHQSFAFHTDVPVEHIITSSFRNPNALHPPSLIAPVHYLVVDAKTSAVVVSLRGTLGLSDLITDLTSSYAPYTTAGGHVGKVHAGMLESAEKVARGPVRSAVIEALNKHPTFSLVLTGHSLGGGVAALLALIWSRKLQGQEMDKFVTCGDDGFPVRPVHCFVYGSPAVMTLDLSRHYKDLITSVIYRHDIVPCLSLGLIRDFRNVAVNLCNEQGMAERVIGKVLGVFKRFPAGGAVPPTPGKTDPDSMEDDLWYWALLKTLRADMKAEKLYPPGSVYWIDATTPAIIAETIATDAPPPPPRPAGKSSSRTALTVHVVDDVEKAFSEFTFSRTMFLDHSPQSYERALQALMVAMKTQEWV